MRLLLLGAGGQLGQELEDLCSKSGVDVVALRRDNGGDIANPEQVSAAISGAGRAIVVNAAAYTKVDKAESEPDAAYRQNCAGPELLAKACARFKVPLIHVSTDYVFDGEKPTPYVESDAVSPLGVYGAYKGAGERAVRAALDRHVILRTAWVYGPVGQNFLRTMVRLAQSREEWGVVNDQFGNPSSTADLALAILAAAKSIQDGDTAWGTYHFAGSGDASWYDFAKEIVQVQAQYTGKHPRVRSITTNEYPTAARRPRNSRLESTLFERTFGYKARPWQERVAEIVPISLGR